MRTLPSRARWMLVVCFGCAVSLGCAVLGVEKGGFNLISLDEEWSMRDDFQRQVAQEYRLVDDSQAVSYINEIGRRIVAQTEMANREWTFGIVDDPGVNAFNLPGGLVYVNRGLMDAADSLDEMVAVLGHEIAHGVARHGTQLMTRSTGLSVVSAAVLGEDPSGTEALVASVFGSGVLADYGRDAEREADNLGIRYAHQAGYDPQGAVEMFQTLLELRRNRPSKVEQFFSSHPMTEERIANARALAQQLGGRGLIEDTAAYQSFRRRLGAGG